MRQPTREFNASLSSKARLVTYGVGFGVGLGVPLILGIAFALAFNTPIPLFLPLAFGSSLLLAWLHRTIGYRITSDALTVLRPIRSLAVEMSNIVSARFPASQPPGNVLGLLRVEGLFGAQGTYWNRSWGKFRVFVTNEQKTVEVLLRNGKRILLSPDDPERFVEAIEAAVDKRNF
jgi:hypothetical protein